MDDDEDHKEIRTAAVLESLSRKADWDPVRGAYSQCIDVAGNPSVELMPDRVVGNLAASLSGTANSYPGEEALYARHVFGLFAEIEEHEKLTPEVFHRLYTDQRLGRFAPYRPNFSGGRVRRRPTPFEAAVETARRLRDCTDIQAVLSPGTSGLLGGSCTYGRFFNVVGRRGREEGSDLDLLVIVPDYSHLGDLLARLDTVDGLSDAAVKNALDRAGVFADRHFDDGYTIFSHRLPIWLDTPDPMMEWADDRCDYDVSLHVLSKDVLDWLLVSNAPKLSSEWIGRLRSIRDYRDRAPGESQDVQRSFSGRYRTVPTEIRRVQNGYLRNSGVYSIHDEHYYPGIFQNLVFPLFDLRWDNVGIQGPLKAFRQKMVTQLRFERHQRRYEYLHLSQAHTRAEFFPPHVLHEIEQSEFG